MCFGKGLDEWCSHISSLSCVFHVFLFIFSVPHWSSRLYLFLSSDKTVKIWLSKVWRKRWETKWLWIFCQLFCCDFSHWSAARSLKATRCDTEVTVSKAVEVRNMLSKLNKMKQNKKWNAFQIFFFKLPILKMPFKSGATWKNKKEPASAWWCINQAKQFLPWHENYHLQPGIKWKFPCVLSPRYQTSRDLLPVSVGFLFFH